MIDYPLYAIILLQISWLNYTVNISFNKILLFCFTELNYIFTTYLSWVYNILPTYLILLYVF